MCDTCNSGLKKPTCPINQNGGFFSNPVTPVVDTVKIIFKNIADRQNLQDNIIGGSESENNNGGKDVAGIAKSNLSEIPVHFTELGVKIEPFTQYFQSPVPNEIIAVKSLFQLQLEMKNSKNNKN